MSTAVETLATARWAQIARLCHETNRAYCQSIGDDSQLPWEQAPQWQRDSAMDGVLFHLDAIAAGHEPSPEASHVSWMGQKERDGWKYGPVKDVEKKEHPCFVPYGELPMEQRRKDYLFCAIVSAMARQ